MPDRTPFLQLAGHADIKYLMDEMNRLNRRIMPWGTFAEWSSFNAAEVKGQWVYLNLAQRRIYRTAYREDLPRAVLAANSPRHFVEMVRRINRTA